MQTRGRNTFITIHTEGALLPVDLLQRILELDSSLKGLTPESYHLPVSEKLNEAINRSWSRLQGAWSVFRTGRSRLGLEDAGTTLTRERWLLPLFQELGYGRLTSQKSVDLDGKSYPISHGWGEVPIHLVGCGLDLDRRTTGVAGAARTSPHSLVQEYLNRREEALWGLLSNGLRLRVLRDNKRLTRQAFLEFDLEGMLEGEIYSDFAVLWLVCHQSRFESKNIHRPPALPEDAVRDGVSGGVMKDAKDAKDSDKKEKISTPSTLTECWLEEWSKAAQEQGTRALEYLRQGVEEAIEALGQGFLQHPANTKLRSGLRSGELTAQNYYRQVLRMVYRLIFLFTAEDRDLLLLPESSVENRERYLRYYSTAQLRRLAERQRGSRHPDRYEGFKRVVQWLGSLEGCPELALPALGGFLFSAEATPDLNGINLENQVFLEAVRRLAMIREAGVPRAVDYRNLGPEELGSVYEFLLELHPLIHLEAGTFELTSAAGNDRKRTGSYYTPSSLISLLLDSALDPVIERTIKEAGTSPENQQSALLNLKVCDPASGSGHFLIASAHRIAGRLAQVRSGGDEPSPHETRRALRDVIRRCIYGVDINPMAVELCKFNLWLESLEPGKPLSFLDSHIKSGNSLVGMGPKMELNELSMPDEAFNPVSGDHKPTAALLKKRNRQEREGQESLFVTVMQNREDLDHWMAERVRILEVMPEDNAAEVRAKTEAYQQLNEAAEYQQQRQIADMWTAAFFWKIEEPDKRTIEVVAPTQGQLRRLRLGQAVQVGLLGEVERLREEEGFFHWPLEFPEVATQGGFDCAIGNPPWERIKLQEEEFFAVRDPEIAVAQTKSARKKMIGELPLTNPLLASKFENAKHAAECSSKFSRKSDRFALTAIGDINTYPLFADIATQLISELGIMGIVVPTGIATADTTKHYFNSLVSTGRIVSIFDFLEARDFFIGLESRDPFCLFTVSGESIHRETGDFVFKMLNLSEIKMLERHVRLSPSDFGLFNPNTRNCPMFYTQIDKELTSTIYSRTPIIENESNHENPWGISFLRMIDMSMDSHLFLMKKKEGYVQLYESKLIHQFDHRWATFEGNTPRKVTQEEKRAPQFSINTRYWVPDEEVKHRLATKWSHPWIISFRNNARANDERTAIFSIIPRVGVGNNAPQILIVQEFFRRALCLLTNFNSLVFDYIARQKIGSASLNFFIVKQLPILQPDAYTAEAIHYISQRVIELVYTAYDLKPFAEDMDYYGEPFRWDEDRRAILRAEIDAYYARLYSLNRKQLRYILDPADLTPCELEDILDPWEEVAEPLDPQMYAQRVATSDFPGETFRVLKEKEIKRFREYRTRRLVLEAWNRLEGMEIGNPDGYREKEEVVPPQHEVIEPHSPTSETRPDTRVEIIPEKTIKPEESAKSESQPMLGDFGLYKCGLCGKMVMGFEREKHAQEKHAGKTGDWKKLG